MTAVLGVDYGEARVGLALGNLETGFARELLTLAKPEAVPAIIALLREREGSADEIATVVIGRPRTVSGELGAQHENVLSFTTALHAALREHDLPPEVVFEDETGTTDAAYAELARRGITGPAAKEQADQVAARIILEGYLAARREG